MLGEGRRAGVAYLLDGVRPDCVELVVVGEGLYPGHFSYGEVSESIVGVYCVVPAARPVYAGPNSLGLRVRITGLVSFVASGLSE